MRILGFVALVAFLGFGTASSANAETFDMNVLTVSRTWIGTFQENCGGCRGALKLAFEVADGRIVSVHAWGKSDETFFKDPTNPSNMLNDYGTATADKIKVSSGNISFVVSGDYRFTLSTSGGAIIGLMDPSLGGARARYKVVKVDLKPQQ